MLYTALMQVNNPACHRCGNKETQAKGMTQPFPEDLEYGAGRVELYACPSCLADTRCSLLSSPLYARGLHEDSASPIEVLCAFSEVDHCCLC